MSSDALRALDDAEVVALAADRLRGLHGRSVLGLVSPDTLAGVLQACLDTDLTGPVADYITDLATEILGDLGYRTEVYRYRTGWVATHLAEPPCDLEVVCATQEQAFAEAFSHAAAVRAGHDCGAL